MIQYPPPDALDSCPRCEFDLSGLGSFPLCPACRMNLSGARSQRAFNFLHVVCDIAFKQWPRRHQFRPACPQHLRAWLFTRPAVNWCAWIDSETVRGVDYLGMHMAAIKASGGYAFLVEEDERLVLKVPFSSAQPKKGGPERRAFADLITRTLTCIEIEAGLDRKDLRAAGLRAIAPNRGFKKRRAA